MERERRAFAAERQNASAEFEARLARVSAESEARVTRAETEAMRHARDEEFRRMRLGIERARNEADAARVAAEAAAAAATEAKAKEPKEPKSGGGSGTGRDSFRGAGRRAPGSRGAAERKSILQNPPSAASLPPRRRLERSLVTPATSPAGPSSSINASGGKTGGGDDGEPSYSPEPPSDDEDAAARVAALRERLSEAARKLHRAEQLAAGFAFGSQGRARKRRRRANRGVRVRAAPPSALAGLAAAVDAAGSTAAADPVTREAFGAHARAVASWFADLQTELETCFAGSRVARTGKDWPTAAPMTDGRFGAARGKSRGARRTRSAAASPSR